jgi:hypothetical protein
MKTIIPLFIIFCIFLFNSILIIIGIFNFNTKNIIAEEYTPLDFISETENFQIIIGIDKNKGRYLSYHYEY